MVEIIHFLAINTIIHPQSYATTDALYSRYAVNRNGLSKDEFLKEMREVLKDVAPVKYSKKWDAFRGIRLKALREMLPQGRRLLPPADIRGAFRVVKR